MTSPRTQRQIVLPMSKAIEIAWRSLRLRFARSVLVTSGIALALAFLMSILASNAITTSIRQWTVQYPRSAKYAHIRAERNHIEQTTLAAHGAEVRAAVRAARSKHSSTPINPKKIFGQPISQWQASFGEPLPVPAEELQHLLNVDRKATPMVRAWLADARRAHMLQQQLLEPAQLLEQMQNAGVPSTPQDIKNNKLQTRWLVGLALLVAFVGILNAMVMSVTERFREIGTMKCLGALDGFILKLFLIESLMQGLVGTVAGVIAGLLLSLASATSTYGLRAGSLLPGGAIALDMAFCLVVGLLLTVAGALYPARQAARMQPIEAMRMET